MLDLVKALSRPQKQAILLAVDLVLVPVALALALMTQFSSFTPLAGFENVWLVTAVLVLLTAALAAALGIHQIQLKSYELWALGKTALLALALGVTFAALSYLSRLDLPVGSYPVFAVFFLTLSAGTRMLMLRLLLTIYRHDQGYSRVLIYGAGTTGRQLALALKTHESIETVAFVDDSPVLQKITVAGLPVYSPTRLGRLLRSRGIDRVLIAMPSLSQPRQAEIARRIADLGVEVQALPSFAQLVGQEELLDKLASVLPGQFLGRDKLDSALEGGCEIYAGRVVLISGAGGSIGSELCRQILNCRPARLVLLELSEHALYSIERELRTVVGDLGTEIVPVLGTVTDRRQVAHVLGEYGVEIVLHAAAYKHVPLVETNPLAGLANNVLGTHTLARAARKAGVGRFILVSTDKAVRPVGVMGASKRLAELVVADLAGRGSGTVFATVRFGNVLGSSGSVVPLFQEQVARGGPVTITDRRMTRYFMTAQEATRLVLRAGSLAEGGEIFVLDMGKPVRIADLARQVIAASGYTVRDADNPEGDIRIEQIGLRPGEKLHEELSSGVAIQPTAHPKILCAQEAALSEFELARALRTLGRALAQGDAMGARAEALRWAESAATAPKSHPETQLPAAPPASEIR